MDSYRLLAKVRLPDRAYSEHDLGFQGVARFDQSVRVLCNLKRALEPPYSEVLEWGLLGLRSRMDEIRQRIGITRETVSV